jgi:nucleotide-binding universal stress UspA family protein
MSYRTIVVGTDGSPTATVAVEVAQKLAKRLRGKLVLVGALDAYGVTRQPLQTALYEAAEAARSKKVDAIAELIEGTPGESILAAAIKHDADLIVVGNRGMGQATRFRLGSVPDWIAHDAPCDLLIVDTTGRAGPREPAPPYSRILAGTDGSGTATEAVRKAYTLASVYAGTVTLVHVGDPLIGAIKLEEVASTRPEDVEVQKRTVEGDPAQRICELAEAEAVQLVVVGNKGMSGVRRFLGSVPNKVAHEVPSDVLIVKTVDRSVEDLVAGHGGLVNVGGRQLDVRTLASLHPHGLHDRLERLGQDVGLPVPRIQVRRRRVGRARSRRGSARAAGRDGSRQGTSPGGRGIPDPGRRSERAIECREGALRRGGREPRGRHGRRDPPRGGIRRRGDPDRRRALVPVRAPAAVEDVPAW